MNPLDLLGGTDLNVDTKVRSDGSCNCCNNMTCCLPWFRRRRHRPECEARVNKEAQRALGKSDKRVKRKK